MKLCQRELLWNRAKIGPTFASAQCVDPIGPRAVPANANAATRPLEELIWTPTKPRLWHRAKRTGLSYAFAQCAHLNGPPVALANANAATNQNDSNFKPHWLFNIDYKSF